MKKLKWLFTLLFLISAVCVVFTGCGEKALDTPTDVSVSIDYKLSWTAVDNAYNYAISIKNSKGEEIKSETTRKNYITVSKLEEGDYTARVKAQVKNYGKNSSWSKPYEFHKDYETGCVYTLINNNTEYEVTKAGSAEGDLVIEDFYRNKPVTSIGNKAFKGNTKITSITLGNNVKTIGNSAFYNCKTLEKVVIPDSVTTMGENVFQECKSLKEVNIPKGIEYINNYTFAYCRALENITIPENIKEIGESAFSSCSALKEVIIPDSVVYIGEYAFSSNTAMTKLTVGKNVQVFMAYAFFECTALTDIIFANECELYYMGEYCFSRCSAIENINLPQKLEIINNQCFYACTSLNEIEIPASVREIGTNVFYNTKFHSEAVKPLTDYNNYVKALQDYNNYDKDLESYNEYLEKKELYNQYLEEVAKYKAYLEEFEKYKNGEITERPEEVEQPDRVNEPTKVEKPTQDTLPEPVQMPDYLIVYCDGWVVYTYGVENINYIVKNESEANKIWDTRPEAVIATIKEGTVGICDYAFMNSTELVTISLADSVKHVGAAAFAYSEKLTKFSTEDDLTNLLEINDYAFYNCTALNRVNVYKGLKKIGNYAFMNCSVLVSTAINVPDTVESIGTYAFKGSGLWNNSVDGIVYAGSWVVGFDESVNIGKVYLKDGTVGISNYAFYNCQTLKTIENLDEITNIGEGAFYNCVTIETALLSNDLDVINDYLFYGCLSLNKVKLPTSELKSIGRSAFYGCISLTELTISGRSRKLESIGKYAFFGCSNLQILDLNQYVKVIDDYAFYGCVSMQEIILPEATTTVGYKAFYKCESVGKITLGSSLESIGEFAFAHMQNVKVLTLPSSLKEVGNKAFYKLTGLIKLDLGSVEKIGEYSFYDITSVKELILPDTLKEIGKYAFKGFKPQSLIVTANQEVINAHALYGCTDATIYTDLKEKPETWNNLWNSSYRPVIWGCTLSEDNSYVVSVTTFEGFISNVKAKGGITAPTRKGYIFLGWSETENSTSAEYPASEIANVGLNKKLYAVWLENTSVTHTVNNKDNSAYVYINEYNEVIAVYYGGLAETCTSVYQDDVYTITTASGKTLMAKVLTETVEEVESKYLFITESGTFA